MLNSSFSPSFLEVVDESHKHAGHAGATGYDGESHFSVKIVSDAFTGKNRVQKHRMVNEALKDLQKSIHALSITAFSPAELQE